MKEQKLINDLTSLEVHEALQSSHFLFNASGKALITVRGVSDNSHNKTPWSLTSIITSALDTELSSMSLTPASFT